MSRKPVPTSPTETTGMEERRKKAASLCEAAG
jgi:hypothetical protein